MQGVLIPSNSLVDIHDLLYRTPNDPHPNNTNGLHDQTLLCETDLEACCESPSHGNWYYPDGNNVVTLHNGKNAGFQSNRGQHQEINGQIFYGSVPIIIMCTLCD